MGLKLLISTSLSALLLVLSAANVFAVPLPSFTSCVNPSGQIVAQYATGLHGIVGMQPDVEGSDTVYRVSEQTYTQCYCPVEGTEGIQTDWWNVKDLSQEDIDASIQDGWIFVANGADWGLEADPFLAKNSSFTCGVVCTPTPTPSDDPGDPTETPTPTPTVTPTPTSGTGSSSHSSSEEVAGTSASSPQTQVLSLASTGNEPFVALLYGVGLVIFFTGLFLRSENE